MMLFLGILGKQKLAPSAKMRIAAVPGRRVTPVYQSKEHMAAYPLTSLLSQEATTKQPMPTQQRHHSSPPHQPTCNLPVVRVGLLSASLGRNLSRGSFCNKCVRQVRLPYFRVGANTKTSKRQWTDVLPPATKPL